MSDFFEVKRGYFVDAETGEKTECEDGYWIRKRDPQTEPYYEGWERECHSSVSIYSLWYALETDNFDTAK